MNTHCLQVVKMELNALQNSLRFDGFSVFGTWWNMVFLKGSWNFVLIPAGWGGRCSRDG